MHRNKVILAIVLVMASSVILLAAPVERASSTHTATIPNVHDFIVDLIGIPTGDETITSMVDSLEDRFKLGIDVVPSEPLQDTSDPLVFFITVSYHGEKRALSSTDITLTEVEDSGNLITTPANPSEIGTSDVFKASLTPSASWEAGDTYTVAISVTDPVDTTLKGYTIASFTVAQRPALDLDTDIHPSNLNGVTVTTGNGASFGTPVTLLDLAAGTKANIVGLIVQNADDEVRKYYIEVGYDDSGSFNPVYTVAVKLRESNAAIADDMAIITIPSPGKAVPADAIIQARVKTTSPNNPSAEINVSLQLVKITV